jgi:hypothetical protein
MLRPRVPTTSTLRCAPWCSAAGPFTCSAAEDDGQVGGGRIGAVLLSPLIRPGTISTVDYNHYSLLRTVEDIFGLPHLGDAAMPQVRSFGPDVSG